MIAIINYDAGNLASVSNALNRLQAEHVITKNQDELNQADAIIFPGVGHAKPAMESLQKNGLIGWLKSTSKPLLGLCLGMQLLFEGSDEGNTQGLGLIPGRLKKFDNSQYKVPHMGWNTCQILTENKLINQLYNESYFYFVHSFYAPVNEFTIASCNYICDFTAITGRDNVFGTQFHPEKSGDAGHQLLKNFLKIAAK